MNIREKTCLIIRRGMEYYVGPILYSEKDKWSTSPFDAWNTRDREEARETAEELGGELWLFNPIACRLKKMEG